MATLGHYELVREIGAGGMATVYEALDTRIGRRVALKVLSLPPYLAQAQGADQIERLQREARAAGRLNHPNIVTLYDVGEEEGHHFLAMEFLNGPTLRERLQQGPLTPLEAAHVLDGLAAALDVAHAEGILHRDIKPGNVILLPDGRVKLADFGVARHFDDATLTRAGDPVGSPAYMAPEQVRGEPASPASDRWSLGILLYEMLAGSTPFVADNVPAVLHRVAYDPAPPLPGQPREIQAVLERALAKDPAARYRSAHELAAAFRTAAQRAAAEAAPTPGRRAPSPAADRAWAGAKGGEVAAPALPRPPSRAGWWGAAAALLALLVAGLVIVSPARRSHLAPVRGHSVVRRPPVPRSLARKPGPRASKRPAARVVVREVQPPAPPPSRAAAPRPALPPAVPRPSVAAARVPPPAVPSPRKRLRSHTARPRRLAAVNPEPASPPAPTEPTARHRRRARLPARADRAPERVETVAPRPIPAQPERIGDRSAAALNARAYRLQKEGRQSEAEPLLREAVRRDPNRAYAQYNLGWSLLSQGKAREALGPLHRTAAQQPDRWEPQHRLAQAYTRLGDAARARQAEERARYLRAHSPRARRRSLTRARGPRRSRAAGTEPVVHLLPPPREEGGREQDVAPE